MIAFPYQMIIPSIMIAVIMVCFNLVADGLRDALDPKMRD
jgi:oligopeptide transport system permease protein